MPKINQLGFEVANLIAAGEVVERPASVVKELLENAIDAGATNILVEIARGGVSLIRVVDNGCGMEAEDLPIAIRRHATSKIATAEDLDSISTLGFRGEALAAISAVSRITIISKTREAECGTMLTAEGGTVSAIEEVGCADGTTVLVEDLFGTVPARRKFLKKDATEAQAVAALLEKVAISRPDISFRLVSDGTVKLSTAGDGQLAHTLYALFGRDYAARLLPVAGTVGELRVSGFVGRPDNAKSNRNHQNCFINGRYVRSKTVSAAIERAYTSYMAPERFPVAVIFLDMPGFAVDVNVHPAKLEVKFSDERAVFEAVYYAVRDALESNTARPAFADEDRRSSNAHLAHSFPREERAEQLTVTATPYLRPTAPAHDAPASLRPTAPAHDASPERPTSPKSATPVPPPTLTPARSEEVLRTVGGATLRSEAHYEPRPTVYGFPKKEQTDEGEKETPLPSSSSDAPDECKPTVSKDAETPSVAKIPVPEPTVELPPYRVAGVLFRCYILVELEDDTVLVIDQHAAHERILFEQLKKARRADGRRVSVGLLVPLSVTLSREEQAAAEEHRAELEALGFSYRIDENGTLLHAIPDDITLSDAEGLFVKMCDEMANGAADPAVTDEMRRERMLYQLACKAAIKGGRAYDEAHIEWLVKEVLSLPDITVCPHGRPVAFTLTHKQMDKMFDRIK